MRTALRYAAESVGGRFDRLHGDEDFRAYSRAEETLLQRETRRLTAEKLADALWWDGRLEGVNALSAEVPGHLARMMGNLDPACRGERFALEAITTALSHLRRQALRDAEDEARDQAERALVAGDL
ncbi:MAG TPA: hypothetical protein VN667_12185 [Burkholderiales bacterium]|nr:hypothetical protein [Burkholderiales bacterium]